MGALAAQVKQAVGLGAQVAVAVGGGNLWRGGPGSQRLGLDRANADYMGMLATVMNGIALAGTLEKLGLAARVQSAVEMRPLVAGYSRQEAIDHLSQGRVVVFVAGIGNPYFPTDTVAALRAAEIGAELVVKATQVDGVYTADPHKDSSAIRFSRISYAEYLARGLTALDAAAVAISRESNIPVIVLSLADPQNIRRALLGEDVGTIIGGE